MLIQKDDEKTQREKLSVWQPSRTAGTIDVGDWSLVPNDSKTVTPYVGDFKAITPPHSTAMSRNKEKTEETCHNVLLIQTPQSLRLLFTKFIATISSRTVL